MKNRKKKKHLYANLRMWMSYMSAGRLKNMPRKVPDSVLIAAMQNQALSDMLNSFDPDRHGGEVWDKMGPVGQEFGAR